MFRPRVIPCLLLKNKGLVKTLKFKNPTYIGDPINAVRIFNEKEADELIFLDITASKENRIVDIDLIKKIADEAYMPFAIGGGIRNIKQVKELINAGAEKVVINTASVTTPSIIKEASDLLGSSSVVVCIDVKKNLWGKNEVYIFGGTKGIKLDPVKHAINMEKMGAGEIMINSIDRDGMMQGYDIGLIKLIADNVSVPVIACGGAGKLGDFAEAIKSGNASAVSAGSMFVYFGPRKGVLINYPEKHELNNLFN